MSMEACPVCEGSGLLLGDPCPLCDGEDVQTQLLAEIQRLGEHIRKLKSEGFVDSVASAVNQLLKAKNDYVALTGVEPPRADGRVPKHLRHKKAVEPVEAPAQSAGPEILSRAWRCVGARNDMHTAGKLRSWRDACTSVKGVLLMRSRRGDIPRLATDEFMPRLQLLDELAAQNASLAVMEIQFLVQRVVHCIRNGGEDIITVFDDSAVALAALERLLQGRNAHEFRASEECQRFEHGLTTMPISDPCRLPSMLVKLAEPLAESAHAPLRGCQAQSRISEDWVARPGMVIIDPAVYSPPKHNDYKSLDLGDDSLERGDKFEEAVFCALRDASVKDGLLVLHGVNHSGNYNRWRDGFQTGHRNYQRGESDFIVLSPLHGLFVIECKSRYTNAQAECARDQAHNSFDAICMYLKQALRDDIYEAIRLTGSFPIGFGLLFGTPQPGGWKPGVDVQRYQVGFSDVIDAHRMSAWLEGLLSGSGFADHVAEINAVLASMGENVYGVFAQALLAGRCSVPCSMNLCDEVSAVNRCILVLTHEQQHVLQQLGHHSRLWIPGVAGSGKTLLAKEMLRRLSHELPDDRILFLSYNSGVCNWVRHQLDDDWEASNIHLHSLSRLRSADGAALGPLSQVVDKLPEGLPSRQIRRSGRGYEMWNLEQAVDMARMLPSEVKYHHIVVDEAQDMPESWLALVEALMVDPHGSGYSWFFFDDTQSIYQKHACQAVTIPPREPWFPLRRVVRNSRNIFWQFVDLYTPVQRHVHVLAGPRSLEPLPPGQVFPGPSVDFIELTADSDDVGGVALEVAAILDSWHSMGLQPGQIAILTATAAAARDLWRCPALVDRCTVLPKEHFNDDRLCVGSILQFKGLERHAVLVVGPMSTHSSGLYVASSRAIGKLAFLDKDVMRLMGDSYRAEVAALDNGKPMAVAAPVTFGPIEPPCGVGEMLEVHCCVAYRQPERLFDENNKEALKPQFGFQPFLHKHWDTEPSLDAAEQIATGDVGMELRKIRVREQLWASWMAMTLDERRPYREEQWQRQFPRCKDRVAREWLQAKLDACVDGGRRLHLTLSQLPQVRLVVSTFEVWAVTHGQS